MFGRTRREKKARSPSPDERRGEWRRFQVMSLLEPFEVERLGRMPVEAIAGYYVGPPPARDPALFKVNEPFVKFLHVVIARWGPSEPQFEEVLAEGPRETNIYILDGRTPTPEGRVPLEDIIGAFEVQAGKVVENSYQAFPEHEVFTQRGLVQLTPYLRERFVFELEQLPVD
jgi:hypothetical protein